VAVVATAVAVAATAVAVAATNRSAFLPNSV